MAVSSSSPLGEFNATPWQIGTDGSASRVITLQHLDGSSHRYICKIHVNSAQDTQQFIKKINNEFVSKMAVLAKSLGLGTRIESLKMHLTEDVADPIKVETVENSSGKTRKITQYNPQQQMHLSELSQMVKTIFKTASLSSHCLFMDIKKLASESSKLSWGERASWGPKMAEENAANIERSLSVLSRITDEVADPDKRNAMISEILARQLAYSNFSEYIKDKGPAALLEFRMKVGDPEKEVTYRFKEELDLWGGYSAVIFTAEGAPPLLLFPGTSPYPGARGSGITVLDDLNPAGPGAGIFSHGREKLEKALKAYCKDGKAKVYGHSLGGALSVRTGILLPHLVESVEAFNPPRQGWRVKGKFNALQRMHAQADATARLLGVSKKEVIDVLNSNKGNTLAKIKQDLYKLKRSGNSDIGFHETVNGLYEKAKIVWEKKGFAIIPDSLPTLNSYLPKINVLQQFHDIADRMEKETGISKRVLIELLNSLNVTETSFRRFTPEIKERLLNALKKDLIDHNGFNEKIYNGDLDETLRQLIALSHTLKKDLKYVEIPQTFSEDDGLANEAVLVDVVTCAGHKFVGNVYELQLSHADAGLHSAPMFITNHKVSQLSKININSQNRDFKRDLTNAVQTVATVIAFTVGSVLLGLKRFLIGSHSSTLHPVRFIARKLF
jgi:hypothetical protein